MAALRSCAVAMDAEKKFLAPRLLLSVFFVKIDDSAFVGLL